MVTAGKDSAWFQTFITRNEKTVCAFDINKEYASWIDDAIIYQITPGIFVKNGKYQNIQDKLSELKKLGVNTIWLQPVFETFGGGQGYDITDYFSLRSDLGNETQLKQLIKAAKALQLHVLFDFVPNHTSIHHPYATDVIKYGTSSHYYNFYQHEDDGVKYSSYYHKDENGFIYYFWKDLINLNYQNEEVQQWMIEACKFWIKEFDIDGYRFDAVWGVIARCPLFTERLKTELKSIKPDLLMLAEDKASDEQVYSRGFDLAYDWASDTSWVSQVSWQYKYDPKVNYTIFNFPDSSKRAEMLRKQLFQKDLFNNRRLRFLENNDLPRFITHHGLERTKMAAALLFSLPGVPMIYCGQETGFKSPLYSHKPIFSADSSIQSSDHDSLFSYYSNLTQLRSSYSALRSKSIGEVSVNPSATMVAFLRKNNSQTFIIIVNLNSQPADAKIDLSKSFLKDKNKQWQFHDVLNTDSFRVKNKAVIPMKSYSTRWLLLQNNSFMKKQIMH
ncbi:MAG: alpha-amylase family glycosyl hydrolase [Segetibacter sp.]